MHILVTLCISVLIAWAFKKRSKPDPLGYWRFIAAGLGAFWPYVDRLVFYFLPPQVEVLYLNSFSWSLLVAPAVAWGLAAGLSYALKGYEPESPYLCRRFFVPILAGLVFSIFLGLSTEQGIAIFAPFWFKKFSLSILHSFDVGLFFVLLVLVVLTAIFKRWRTEIARGLIIVLCLYIGVVGTFKIKAIQVGKAYASTMGLEAAAVYTIPQALSPFYWHIVVITADGRLHSTKVSLKRVTPLTLTADASAVLRAKAAYMPVQKAVWNIYSRFGRKNSAFAAAAWQHGFARLQLAGVFAVFQKKAPYEGAPCAWFKDLRFKESPTEGQYIVCHTAEEWETIRQKKAAQSQTRQQTPWQVYYAAEDGSFLLLAEMY